MKSTSRPFSIVSKQPQKLLIHSLQGTEDNHLSLQFDTYQIGLTLIYDDGIASTVTLLEKPFDDGPLHEVSYVLVYKVVVNDIDYEFLISLKRKFVCSRLAAQVKLTLKEYSWKQVLYCNT